MTEVPCFHPFDLRFRGPAGTEGNPFLTEVRALLQGPDGRATAVPGFYDGEGTWIVRVCPDAAGTWRYVTDSAAPELDGQEGTLECVPNANPRVHGALRVDPAHPHHFVYQDGTRPFVLGYEANWLWALGFLPDGESRLRRFAARIADHGFNHVFVNAYAHDTRWCEGRTSADDYGPPPAYAWEGTNEAPDHRRPNVAYWRTFDVMMRALFEQGLSAHIYLRVYNKRVTWPANRSLADDLYFKYVVARYQGFSNVVWDFSKESYNEPDKAYLESRLSLIRGYDGYGRLLTTHDDDLFDTDPRYIGRTDFVTDQHHFDLGATAIQRRGLRAAPYLNEEFAYECGPGGLDDKTYGRSNTAEEHALRSWEVVFGGAYPGYYYTYTAWDVIRSDDEPPGYRYHHWLSEFMRESEWWRLAPHPEMVVRGGWCLADPGRLYLVFSPGREGGGAGSRQDRRGEVRLTLIGAPEAGRRFACAWLHPLRGERAETEVALGPRGALVPPWGEGGPFVARLRPLVSTVGARTA
ncbi:MAG TPA: DUF5060 domain-containing protein [Chloroflexota bacterium]|nr:DUF5060 domain-containing protein [Chloroflexota bacterium]